MSDNAYVGQINVMQGARIAGDIISNYEEVDEEGDLRLTTLTFGQAANNEGHSIFVADSDFSLTYDGNITGQNLSLQINGGNTKLTGITSSIMQRSHNLPRFQDLGFIRLTPHKSF